MKASPGSRFIHALQVGGLLALGIFLWGISLFPIQRADLVCECSVLVSPREHTKLSEFRGRSRDPSGLIGSLDCEPRLSEGESDRVGSESGEVSVRRVKLRLGVGRRASAAELEEALAELTTFGMASQKPTVDAQRAYCRARWQLQVAEHALARFRLDCSRQGIELADPKDSRPFRLVSQSSATIGPETARLYDSLRSEIETARRGMEAAEQEMSMRERETRGVVTMSGTPRFAMRGGSLARFRLALVLISTFGVLGVIALGWKRDRIRKRPAPTGFTRAELTKMLDGLRIPYLGVIPLEGEAKSSADAAPRRLERRSPFRLYGLYRLSKWSRWSDRVLILWIACFVLRYLLDPPWRELLFHAPLAAFSSILFGV